MLSSNEVNRRGDGAEYAPADPLAFSVLLVADDPWALEQGVVRGGTWVHPAALARSTQALASELPPPCTSAPAAAWPRGLYPRILLSNGVERLDRASLAQLAERCLGSLHRHGEIALVLRPGSVDTARCDVMRQHLSHAWPLYAVRRRAADGSECFAWRRDLWAVRGAGRGIVYSPAAIPATTPPHRPRFPS